MNLNQSLKVGIGSAVATAIAMSIWLTGVRAETNPRPVPKTSHVKHAAHNQPAKPAETFTAEQLAVISGSVDLAIRQLEAGKHGTALHELKKLRLFIAHLLKPQVKPSDKAKTGVQKSEPAFVNKRCPIMGSPIDPRKVTSDLVREYKGRKVAFCCGGCPDEWDKLTDAEKDAKLAKADK